VLNLVTWNTADIDPPGNTSHAEHQFVNWVRDREKDEPGFMKRVEKITINNFTRSPCSECGPELAGLLTEIKGVRGQPVYASIAWTKLHSTGAQPTSWESLKIMTSAGWRLSAPASALPPEENVKGVTVYLI
jgi:hypothetical protein